MHGWFLYDHVHLLLQVIGEKNISEIMHDLKSYTTNKISKILLSQYQLRDAVNRSQGTVNGSRGTAFDPTQALREASTMGENDFLFNVNEVGVMANYPLTT
ncbi:transposase [Patescibacteria group bacterium]|nr:transposase [Patescibacteria group bacterium]MBU1891139.1 transposase [Patescibacteria group bacterium]